MEGIGLQRKQDFKVLCRDSEGILFSFPEENKQRIKEALFQITTSLLKQQIVLGRVQCSGY